MRILITTIVDPKRSAYSRMHAFAIHLSKRHSVTILSVNDSWKASLPSSKKYEEEFEKSMTSIETVFITDKKKSLVSQELFSKRPLKHFLARKEPFDLILDYNTLSIGRKAQDSAKGVVRIYDLADDLVDMVRSSPQLPRPLAPFAAKFAGWLIDRSIRRADTVTGTTGTLLDSYDVPAEKRCIIPNGIPDSFLEKIDQKDIIDSRKTADEFLIGYVGVLREWLDFESVFEAMKAIRTTTPVRLLIIGEEGDRERVKGQAERIGVSDSVSMLGTVPHDKIRSYLAACDCGIVPFGKSRTSDFALPLKVFEYLSAGLPVVSTSIKSVKENFPDTILFYENTSQLIETINRIRSDRQSARRMAESGMKKVESDYTWGRILEKLDGLIEGAEGRGSI